MAHIFHSWYCFVTFLCLFPKGLTIQMSLRCSFKGICVIATFTILIHSKVSCDRLNHSLHYLFDQLLSWYFFKVLEFDSSNIGGPLMNLPTWTSCDCFIPALSCSTWQSSYIICDYVVYICLNMAHNPNADEDKLPSTTFIWWLPVSLNLTAHSLSSARNSFLRQ